MSKTNFLHTREFENFVQRLLAHAGWIDVKVRWIGYGADVLASKSLIFGEAALQLSIRVDTDKAYVQELDIRCTKPILDPESFLSLSGKELHPDQKRIASDAWIIDNPMGVARLLENYDKMAKALGYRTLFAR